MLDARIAVLNEIRGATDQQCQEHGKLLMLRDQRDAGTLIERLDDGFVRLVDHMGNDQSICRAARVSYGAGTKSKSDDRALIRYMMAHKHTSPFESVEFQFHVRVPMDCWRQWIRHRTASVNEYSTRYSEAIDSAETTAPDEWRLQSTINKQGSGDCLAAWPEGTSFVFDTDHWDITLATGETLEYFDGGKGIPAPGVVLCQEERKLQKAIRHVYQSRLGLGVAREQARKDLPLSTYTEAYWKIDCHNLLHFLELRLHKSAQLEIRTYAEAIGQLIKPIVPATWEAFEDYRLKAITLTYPEQQVISLGLDLESLPCKQVMSDRERKELAEKMKLLGIESPQPVANGQSQ